MNANMVDPYSQVTHWARMGEYYALYGSPLSPCGQDIAAFQRAIDCWRSGYVREHLRILLCGVTPGIAGMSWPDDAEILAVDRSEAVIHALWPRPAGRRWPLCGDWLHLPQADASCDIAAGDGSFNCMNYPQGYLALASSLHRILRTGGLLLMRCFIRPDRPEEPAQLFTDLRAGQFTSFHHFKWRLAMAMQADVGRGVLVSEVFEAWVAAGMSVEQLSRQTGWDQKVIETIQLYEGKQTPLSFPSLAELQAVLRSYFDPISIERPQYPLGERCPTVAFIRRME